MEVHIISSHYTPIGMAKIKRKNKNTIHWETGKETKSLIY